VNPLENSAGIWAIVPPFAAIILALITKEVIFSLLIGIMAGALVYSVFTGIGIIGIFTVTIDTMANKLGDVDNAAMILFLALLGALVALIVRAGGTNAYGAWAVKKIKTQRSAGLLTGLLGLIVFIDDYFNCLTIGAVMRPITDRNRLSREKLAYLIDAAAAPICVIAPISSWAASVISFYPTDEGITGMQAFISSIPMNLYALLTIFMIFWLIIRTKSDYGPMALAQRRANETGIVESSNYSAEGKDELDGLNISPNGKVADLIVPVTALALFSVLAMLWYGGYWHGEGKSVFNAFGDTNASFALALGGFGAVIIAFVLFVPRGLFGIKEFFTVIGKGVKTMVPALMILTLAWTMSGICRERLMTGEYVAALVESSSMPIALIPAIVFTVAAGLSFATGSSWGTFGILIPIAISICDDVAPHLSILSLSAVLAGSVFGDHSSPISDTTVLASTGAHCNYMDHITTQIPYAATVAAVSLLGYIVSGFVAPYGYAAIVGITLPLSVALLIIALLILPKVWVVKGSR
jgi:Na+/H+ antiporter NhaC